MTSLRFHGRVVIITGAGRGIGKSHALTLASLGCQVVVNDILKEHGVFMADVCVKEILQQGGKAISNHDSVTDPKGCEALVQQTLATYGRIDILINNAGILRDKTFAKMDPEEWQVVQDVHVTGAFLLTKLVWIVFLKQKYGRIIMTSSAAGLYGNVGQSNYAAAKSALIGFGKTLAIEGRTKGIHTNIIAPFAQSQMTEKVVPKDLLEKLSVDWIAPVVAYLCHESCTENGSVFELGAGFITKLRWQRSHGLLLNMSNPQNKSQSIIQHWDQVISMGHPHYPDSIADPNWVELAKKGLELPLSHNPPLPMENRVAIITGAGGGLGRAYALHLAKLGVKVVVVDTGGPLGSSGGQNPAEAVVQRIRSAGGIAIASFDDIVTRSREIVDLAMKTYGRIDILVNNAGILRDLSFAKMTLDAWQAVMNVHLHGTFAMTKAVWPVFWKQKYGRIVNTTSAVGLYGNFGQSNYSAAKAGILGLSLALSEEVAVFHKKSPLDIKINVISPHAGTAMTATVLPPEMVDLLKPEYVAPFMTVLCSKECPCSGWCFEAGAGWAARVRIERSVGFKFSEIYTIDQIASIWPLIVDFSREPTSHPNKLVDAFYPILDASLDYSFTEKDVLLYNISIGAQPSDLPWVYEGSPGFCPIGSFAVLPALEACFKSAHWMKQLPPFDMRKLLHTSHSIHFHAPLATASHWISTPPKIIQLVNTKQGIRISLSVCTFHNETLLFTNIITLGIRDLRVEHEIPRHNPTKSMAPTNHPSSISIPLSKNAAILYRLTGDRNPLHVDPAIASFAGFPKPILHGLSTLGHVFREISSRSKPITEFSARFTKPVYPGETLYVQLQESDCLCSFTIHVERESRATVLEGSCVFGVKCE